LNALVAEYQRAFGLGLEEVAAATDAGVPRTIVVLPALSFISPGAPDVGPLDPSLPAAVAVTLSVVARSVADSNDVCVVAEEIVAPGCAAAAAKTPGTTRRRNRRRTGATLPSCQCDGRSDLPAADSVPLERRHRVRASQGGPQGPRSWSDKERVIS
jgi:hypothetical protein